MIPQYYKLWTKHYKWTRARWNRRCIFVSKKKLDNSDLTWQTCSDGSCGKKIEWSLSFLNPDSILGEWKWYKAPDLVWLDNWINSEAINSLDDLEGKIIMIDFWTLWCVNCINTHKETNKIYDEFRDEWFEILWLHAPEFAYERKIENVSKAVKEFEMEFPVATDNDFSTWKAYNNRYWPAFYIIDAQGNVRYTHFGEGWYEKKRAVIKELFIERNNAPRQDFLQRWNLRTNTAIASIDIDLVLRGGPTKDGIPSINDPKFLSQAKAEKEMPYLFEGSRGIVLDIKWQQRYYPYDVLVWHEIVNDDFKGEEIAVTFCPLCWSAVVYDRNVNGREVNFWVSGRLYHSNLLMFDTYDETLWSQSLWEAVVWWQTGAKLRVVKSQLMSYEEFVSNFPKWKVLSDDTWYFRQYGTVPYGDYDTNDELIFPVEGADDIRFHKKELFYIVNNGDDSVAFHWGDLRAEWRWEIQVGEDIYIATFNNGLADVTLNNIILPWYYEMWFSWISHNENSKNIWNK